MALLWSATLSRLGNLAYSAGEHFMRILGVLLIVFGGALIGGCVVLYYYFLLPFHYPEFSVGAVVHLLISVWLVLNIAFHYYTAVTSSAGSPPRDDVESIEEARAKYPRHYRYCRHCTVDGTRVPRRAQRLCSAIGCARVGDYGRPGRQRAQAAADAPLQHLPAVRCWSGLATGEAPQA